MLVLLLLHHQFNTYKRQVEIFKAQDQREYYIPPKFPFSIASYENGRPTGLDKTTLEVQEKSYHAIHNGARSSLPRGFPKPQESLPSIREVIDDNQITYSGLICLSF